MMPLTKVVDLWYRLREALGKQKPSFRPLLGNNNPSVDLVKVLLFMTLSLTLPFGRGGT